MDEPSSSLSLYLSVYVFNSVNNLLCIFFSLELFSPTACIVRLISHYMKNALCMEPFDAMVL